MGFRFENFSHLFPHSQVSPSICLSNAGLSTPAPGDGPYSPAPISNGAQWKHPIGPQLAYVGLCRGLNSAHVAHLGRRTLPGSSPARHPIGSAIRPRTSDDDACWSRLRPAFRHFRYISILGTSKLIAPIWCHVTCHVIRHENTERWLAGRPILYWSEF